MSDPRNGGQEPEQLPRFGPLRRTPPKQVVAMLPGAAPGTAWTARRMGVDGGFPNGGLWRVAADRQCSQAPAAAVVKRTGSAYLGTFEVWRSRADPSDPQWWGREAAFYESELATVGWPDGVRAARCVIDDHETARDLWLEEISDSAPVQVCQRAVAGLAHWQVANTAYEADWLSDGWICTHVRRHRLDNEQTLAHPAWPSAIERGLDPVLRDHVSDRVTDPAEVHRLLAGFPRMLTHHDFHNGNIGTSRDDVVVIDWSYVGAGPIGHDAGHLALTLESQRAIDPAETWQALENAYSQGLAEAGYRGDLSEVRRSMAVSNHLRLGWMIDNVLDNAESATDEELLGWSHRLRFLAELR